MPPILAAESLFGHLGLFGVSLASLLQSMGVPIPAILVLAPMGVMIAQGKLEVWQVVVFYIAGQTAGDCAAYAMTVYNRPLLHRIFPRLLHKLEHPVIQRLFAGSAARGLLLAYFLSYFRPVVNYLAPLLHIRFGEFLLWSFLRNAIGNGLYVTALLTGMDLFAKNEAARPWLIGGIVVLVVGIWLWRRRPPPPAAVEAD